MQEVTFAKFHSRHYHHNDYNDFTTASARLNLEKTNETTNPGRSQEAEPTKVANDMPSGIEG